MKKYLLVLLLTIFIIPSIALASWWNPFSWKIFYRSVETKIEQPIIVSSATNTVTEESSKVDQSAEIEKLKKEVEGLKKKTNSTPPVSDSEFWSSFQKKSIPANNNQANNTISTSKKDPKQDCFDNGMIIALKGADQIDPNLSFQERQDQANMNLSNMTDLLYLVRVSCGDVTDQDQVLYELQKIKQQFNNVSCTSKIVGNTINTSCN